MQNGNKHEIASIGYGKVRLSTVVPVVVKETVLNDVLCILEFMYNLISISQAWRMEFRTVTDNQVSNLKRGILILLHKPLKDTKMVGLETGDGLYKSMVTVRHGIANIVTCGKKAQWHDQLGHCGRETLR